MPGFQTTFLSLLRRLGDAPTYADHREYHGILPDTKTRLLVGVMKNMLLDESDRSTAAVMLRRLVTSDFEYLFGVRWRGRSRMTHLREELLACMEESPPNVDAGAAPGKYISCCVQILTLYLEPLVIKLEAILAAKFNELVEFGSRRGLERILTTITSVADMMRKYFLPRCADLLMPVLNNILEHCTTEHIERLRGKTIQCIMIIGLAAREEKFMREEAQVVEKLVTMYLNAERLPSKLHNGQPAHLIMRICKKGDQFAKQFAQHLPTLMAPLMRTAAEFEDAGEANINQGLERKWTAWSMLRCFAASLKEDFALYAEDVARVMVPLLKWSYGTNYMIGVRQTAASSLSHLLECARFRGAQCLEDMWAYVLPNLLQAIDDHRDEEPLGEYDEAHLSGFLSSLAQCIESMGAGCLSPENMEDLLRIINKITSIFLDFLAAPAGRFENINGGGGRDDNQMAGEQILVQDNLAPYLLVLSKVRSILRSLLSAYGDQFYPHLDAVIPNLVNLLSPMRSHFYRVEAFQIFIDVIKYGGPSCVKYRDVFLEPLTTGLGEREPEIRQVAASGCGVLAQFGGEQFAAVCAERVLTALVALINQESHSEWDDNNAAVDIAVCAVAAIIKYNCAEIDRDELIRQWWEWLPMDSETFFLCELTHGDESYPDEAPHLYGLLCDLVAEENVALATPEAKLRVIALFDHSFKHGLISSDKPLYAQMQTVHRQIQSTT